MLADLTTQADLLALASAPALAFDDPAAATENLSMMRVRPGVLSRRRLHGATGASSRATSSREREASRSRRGPATTAHASPATGVELFQPIVERNARVGTVYVAAQYELMRRLGNYLVILGAVLLAEPRRRVRRLRADAGGGHRADPRGRRRGDARDRRARLLAARRQRRSDDEVGTLVDAFNAMLAEVGQRAEEIEASNRSLQGEMLERRAAEEALRAADRRKDEFLATLAHELRNPLAPLRNGARDR